MREEGRGRVTRIPSHIERELDRLGVPAPRPLKAPPLDDVQGWRPSYPGEEPPF